MSNANNNTPADKPSRIKIRNRQKILDAALDVFSRYGYRGSTVAQIAERAEMSKANLLYYYKSKNDIYVKVLESTLSARLAPLIDIEADGDPFEQIWAYTQSKLQLSIEQPEASSRLLKNRQIQRFLSFRQIFSISNDMNSIVVCNFY